MVDDFNYTVSVSGWRSGSNFVYIGGTEIALLSEGVISMDTLKLTMAYT